MDNYVTHKHAKVDAWLARNPRLHMHFTPTCSSRLDDVERWFALITGRAIRRNSFTSVRELRQQVDLLVQRCNADAPPFKWVATADSILRKVETIARRFSATGHWPANFARPAPILSSAPIPIRFSQNRGRLGAMHGLPRNAPRHHPVTS